MFKKIAILFLLIIGLANASVNMSFNSTTGLWNMTNSWRSYYQNATNAGQISNNPFTPWSMNTWCINSTLTGFRCADTESGFTWTNRTDNSTYALLVGTKTYTFTGGRTLTITITYYLNDTDDKMMIVPNLEGNFNFVGQLTWRTHNIQIGGWKYWDWARVWLTNGTNDYPLNTTANTSFPSSTIATKSYYLYDSNTSEFAQTWWDRNLNLNIVKGTEFNDYMDLLQSVSMSGTWNTNFTLWWVDASPCTGILAYMDTPTTNQVKYLGDNFTMTGHWIQDVPNIYCSTSASVTAQYQNSSGAWKAMNATTNLSTTSANPITRTDGIFYQTATYVVEAGITDNDILGNYSIRILVTNNGYTFLSSSVKVNVTANATCELIGASTTFSANHTRCQNITADNVVVDCYGFGVSPELSSLPYAKYAFYADNVKGITIKNCKINGTNTGIYLNRVNFSAVYNNTLTHINKYSTTVPTSYGFQIENSRNLVIENNTMYNVTGSGTTALGGGSTSFGIYLDKSNNSQFYNNTIDTVWANDNEFVGIGAGIYFNSYDYNNSFLRNYINNTYSYGLYFSTTIFNSTFKNNRYHNSTGYGVYLGSVYNLTMENEDIRGATTSTYGFAPTGAGYSADTNSFKNISIQNATTCFSNIYSLLSNIYFQNFTISNCTTAIDWSYATNVTLGNSTIAQSTNHYVGNEIDVPPQYGVNNTLFNISGFNRALISMGGNSNLTVKWYARVSVKDSAGGALTSTINVSSNLSQPVYYGYQSVSPYFEVNDTLFGSGAMTWNNHSIVVNLSGYTTNLTYFNISYRDATINVTLYLAVPPDTTPPNVSINTPTYQQNVSGVISINATVNDSGGMDSSKVYYRINSSTTNVTGWVQMTNASSGGQNYYNATFNTSTIADGWYNVTVNATDLAGNQNSSVSQPFKIDNTAPTLTFVYPTPANASNLSQTWVYVNVSVNEPADNCSLNWNTTRYWLLKFNSTVWYKNMTSLADGNYTYNATCNDTMGFNASTENRTVRLDTVAPELNFVYPTPSNNQNLSQSWVYVNVTINETSYAVLLNWSGTWYVMTRLNNSVWYLNRTGLADNTYTYNVWANDTTNNTGNTSLRNITIDTVAPTITFVTPTPPDNSVWNYSWVYVNITTNEPTQTALLNWSGTWYSMTAFNSTNWYKNVTGLPDGIYNYSVYANDTANNTGTASRNLTIELLCTWINQSVTLGADRYKCQNITASSITLDCNGHTIWLNSSNPLGIHGIKSEHNNYNTTIKNCIIDGGQAGIIIIDNYLLTSRYNYIYNNTIRNTYNESATATTTSGMILYGDGMSWDFIGITENNTIYNITANCTGVGCSATAYAIFGSAMVSSSFTSNNISKVTANTSGYGFYGVNDPGSTGLQFINFTRNNFENIKTMDIFIPTINTKINFFNNTYRNSKQVAYCSSGNILPTVDGDSIFGTSNTTIGYQFINALGDDAPQFKNVLISDVKNSSSSYAIMISGSSLFGVTPKLANVTIANSSRAIYLESSGTNITDSNIINSSIYDAVLVNAYNTTFLNTTFNKTNVSLILSNLTVQWYARVNVTNSSGSALVATINDTDNQSNHAFYGYYSLSPFFIVNDTFISSVANFSFNNHMIIANYTPYADNITSFNFSYRDATVNLTIYEITNTAPNVTIQSPPNGYAFNGTSILSASFIAIDDNASTMNCTLYSNATGAISVGNASDSVANNTLTWFNFTVPGDLDSPLWINITCTDGSLTGVSNATNISRWECWNISFDTTLTEDVSHWGSCFHVINNQTSLDCNGHSIVNQDVHGDTGSGVYFEEKNAITIENCWFSRYPVAIYPVNVNDTVIRNNTIFSNASVSNTAGILWTTTGVIPHMVNNSIYNNTIEINSTNGYAIGVYVVNGGWDLNGTNIENNTIRANSTNGLSVGVDFNAFGLWLYKTNVSNNKITTISTTQPSYGIYLSSTSEANETEVLNNNISSRSNNNLATGILIRNGGIDFNKTTIRNNTVNSSARLDQATGIELDNGGGTTMGDNVIKNNIIYVNSTNSAFDSYGAYVLDVRTSLFSNNDFYAQSQIGTAYGIMLDGALSDSNNFTQNHFYYGNWSLAVVNGNADQNLFWLNTFSAKRTYGGYVGDISGDNYYNSSHYGNYWGDILSTTICDSNGDGIGDTFTPYDFTKGNVTDLVEDYHPLTPKVCGVVGGGGGGIGIIPLAGGCLDGTKIQECSTVNVGWICADNKELEVANQCQPQKVEERPILPSWWEWNKLIVAICTMVAIYYLWDERDTLFQIVPELPEEEVMEE